MSHSARSPLLLLAAALLGLASLASAPAAQSRSGALPPVRHVFLIVLDNKSFEEAFAQATAVPYLARTLPKQGALLEDYYAIGHWSLPNFIALVSGQGPNGAAQRDCMQAYPFRLYHPGLDSHGQALGIGCIYPTIVKSLPDQLEAAGLTWKGYMEDLGMDAARDRAATCSLGRIGKKDMTSFGGEPDQYTARHDPFVYFHTILDNPARCAAHVVTLDELTTDLRSVASTPNFAFISPDLCHDGEEKNCFDGKPGGLGQINGFLEKWVPLITRSPAFRKDGLLIITFAQSDGLTPADYDACCHELPMSADPDKPGFRGPGGGRVGAVALSPFIRPGTVSSVPYNHYALLRTVEDIFGLGHLGFAGEPDLRSFGPDVFTRR